MAYLTLFFAFFKVGIIGFGGGIAMLPLILQSVQQFGIVDADTFRDLVAISQITPGAISVNTATYVGELYAGPLGAVFGTVGMALPSFVLMVLAMKFYEKYKTTKIVSGVMEGVMPAAVGLIGTAMVFIATGVLWTGTHINIIPVIMFGVSTALALWNKINPVIILVGMGIIGAFIFS